MRFAGPMRHPGIIFLHTHTHSLLHSHKGHIQSSLEVNRRFLALGTHTDGVRDLPRFKNVMDFNATRTMTETLQLVQVWPYVLGGSADLLPPRCHVKVCLARVRNEWIMCAH